MSQSPIASNNLGSLSKYQQGWRALNRLLHENKSFSGRETNNAFLNCGEEGRFADISTAIGWDFADDARAIGTIDWDWDGDLDLWVSNRTAPRIRLLKNNLKSDASFLGLQLIGDGRQTNRDGIGARVELYLKGQKTPLLRTRHAGQSFLSQSSRWLHFGLGNHQEIEHVTVQWPGGKKETFSGLQANGFYDLYQGQVKAVKRRPPTITPKQPSTAELPLQTEIARIIPPAGHAIPQLSTQSEETIQIKKNSLISFWSRTCPHCEKELTSWASEKERWAQADLEVLLLSTDQESPEQCNAFLKKLGIDFKSEMASNQTIEIFDALQASLVDLWLPIPLPSSFLVSNEGELLAIYRGPVSREQVLSDLQLSTADASQRRKSASPFQGRWVEKPLASNPQRTTRQLLQRNQLDAAIAYLSFALSKPFVKGTEFDRGDNYLLMGQLFGQAGKTKKALMALKQAYSLLPYDIRVLRLLLTAYRELDDYPNAQKTLTEALNRYPENPDLYQDGFELEKQYSHHKLALSYLDKSVQLEPQNPKLRFQLVQALLRVGQARQAIENSKKILRSHPKYLPAANQLSRIFSTHPDETIRSPQEALILAERLCQITQNRDAAHLVALGLANANLGKYNNAKEILARVQKAVPEDSLLGKEVSESLKVIDQNQPVRNDQWPSSPE